MGYSEVLADLGFLGGGKMASAIYDGLRSNECELSCAVYEPDQKVAQIWKSKGAIVFESAHALLQSSKWLIWAVKPQVFKSEKSNYEKMDFVGEGMISVMAGISSLEIENLFPEVAVVRTMPNTPLMLKQGMVALAKGSCVLDEQLDFVASLFEPVAKTIVVEEAQIDGVTAISGSGPAYLFYLTEHLVDHCVELNLDAEEITLLWSQTLRGAADMLENSGMQASQLREQVTSPGGTTQAALESMMSCELGQNFAKGILAAHQRSLELSQ
jgi:pyrroline-5-carboxylate reductase